MENLSYTNVRSKCIVQYLVCLVDGQLFTELYVEPQDGLTTEAAPERRLFRVLSSLILNIDQQLVSSIYTFDSLVNAITAGEFPSSILQESKPQKLGDRVCVITPTFGLSSLVDLGTRHDETFVAFDVECSTAEQRERQSTLLHGVLRYILANITDIAVPNPANLLLGSSCFAKLVNSNEINLVFLIPLDAVLTATTSGSLGGALSAPSSGSSSASSNASAFMANSPLKASIFQCFRGAEPPLVCSRHLRDLLHSQNGSSHYSNLVLHDRFLPTSSSILSFCELLQYEYRRGFVKALYTQLRDGHSICASDFEYAISACKEYAMEIDLTQFARIVRRLPEGLRRSGGNKTPSTTGGASAEAAAPATPVAPEEAYDVEKDFNQTFSRFFQRVPHSSWHFFYSPPTHAAPADVSAILRASGALSTVEIPSIPTEETADADLDPVEKPPEDQEEEMEEQMAAEGEDGWQADPGRAPLSKSTSGPSGVFSFPFFVRLESVVYPKAPADDDSSDSVASSSGNKSRSSSRTATVPIGISGTSGKHSYAAPARAAQVAPTLTLPTPRNQATFNASSMTAGKMTLRLVCVVLPRHSSVVPNQGDTIPTSSSPANFSGESPATLSVLDRPASDPNSPDLPPYTKLPKTIRGILHEVKRYVRAVVAQQVLCSLREKAPVTKGLLDAVQYYMTYLSSPALVRYSVPLWFHDPREGRNLFLSEMEHSALFKIERLDRTFVVVRKNPPAAPTTGSEIATSTPVPGPSPAAPYIIPHWMILTVHDDKVKIKFNSLADKEEKLKEYKRVRAGLKAINDRVNQLCLLHQLNETRMCSILLVPATEQDNRLSMSDMLPIPQSPGGVRLAYPSGHFACPVVHEFRLPIFHRLDPREAEGALVAAALHHFSISNRSNMYVIREQNGNIFYILLSLGSDEPHPATGNQQQKAGAAATSSKNFVHFRVHGVNSPTKEITHDLPILLESKLADKALQSLAKLLLRNPLLKLTPADVELVKPSDQKPRRFAAPIPKCISDVHLFCGYLKQNLGKQQMSIMNFAPEVIGSAVADDLSNEFIYNNMIPLPNLPAKLNFGAGIGCVALSLKGTSTDPDSALSPLQELQNCVAEEVKLSEMPEIVTGPTMADLRAQVTKKLEERKSKQKHAAQANGFNDAMISLWLRGKSSSPNVAKAVQMWLNDEAMDEKAVQDAAAALMQEVSQTLEKSEPGQHHVEIQVWSRGSLKVESLLDHVANVINQTCIEYQFENFHGAAVDSLASNHVGMFVTRSYELFQKGASLGIGNVRSLNNTKVVVPSWAMHQLLVELQDLIKDGSGNLYPNLYMNQRPHNDLPVMSFTQTGQERASSVAAMEAEARSAGSIVVQPGVGVLSLGEMSEPRLDDNYCPFTVSTKSSSLGNLADPSGLLMSKNRTRFVIIASKQHSASHHAAADPATQVGPADLPFTWASGSSGSGISSSSSPNGPVAAAMTSSSSLLKSGSNNSLSASTPQPSVAVSVDKKLQNRRSFGMIIVSANQLCLMTYNWNPSLSESFLADATRLQDWLRLRLALLNNILHQKMGLFHHIPAIPDKHFNAAFAPAGGSLNNASQIPTRGTSMANIPSVSGAGGAAGSAEGPLPPGTSGPPARGTDPMAARGGMMKFNRFKAQRPGGAADSGASGSSSKDVSQPANNAAQLERSGSQATVPTALPRSGSGPGSGVATPSASTFGGPLAGDISASQISGASGAPSAPRQFKFDSQFDVLMTSFVPPSSTTAQTESGKAGKSKPKPKAGATPAQTALQQEQAGVGGISLEAISFDSILRRASPAILPARKHDPVQRHALQIKQLAQRQQRLAQAGKVLSSVYHLWAKSQDRLKDQSIDEDTLATLLKTCRLHHVCRIPFFIADLYKRDSGVVSSVPPPDHRSAEQKQTAPAGENPSNGSIFIGPEQRLKLDSPPIPSACLGTKAQIDARRKWRQGMLEKFIDDYGKYLQTFGLARVEIKTATSSSAAAATANSAAQSSGYQKFEIYPESKTIYFQKVFRGGLLLAALGWDGAYVTLTLFSKFSYAHASVVPIVTGSSPSFNPTSTTSYLFGAIPGSVDELRRRVAKQIRTHTEEASRLKDALHMNSFVYDFHVRQFTEFFEQGQPGDYPGDELINMMQAMVLFYQGPKHARNSIRTSSFTVELGRSQLSPLEIFAFLSQNANKYNLYSTSERGLSPGVFMVSSSSEMVNKPRNRHGQMLEQMEEESFTLLACITDSTVGGSSSELPLTNTDNLNLICQFGSWKKYFPDGTTQLAKPRSAPVLPPVAAQQSPSTSGPNSRSSSLTTPSGAGPPPASGTEKGGSSPQGPTGSAVPSPVVQPASSTSSFRNLASFLQSGSSQQPVRANPAPAPSASTRNLRDLVERSSTGLFSSLLGASNSPAPAPAPAPAPEPEKLRCFDIAFFVLRTNKGTIFPLSSVSQRLTSKSPIAAVEAIVQQPEMQDAIAKSRVRLMESTQQAFVHSERDMLWTRLTREGSANDAALSEEQFKMLSKLVEMRDIEELDPSLKEMFVMAVDWNIIFQHLSNTFGNRSRRFFFDGIVHLLLFSTSDRDSILYMTLDTTPNQPPGSCPVEIHVCRRETRATAVPYKMAQAEAALVSSAVNVILHWLWRSMVIRDRRPRQ